MLGLNGHCANRRSRETGPLPVRASIYIYQTSVCDAALLLLDASLETLYEPKLVSIVLLPNVLYASNYRYIALVSRLAVMANYKAELT